MTGSNYELVTEERIAALENELKGLKKESENLKKYEKLMADADELAVNLAIYRDAFIRNGFTDNQANALLISAMSLSLNSR